VTPILEAQGIVKQFRGRGRSTDVLALDGVDFCVKPGEVVGIVGMYTTPGTSWRTTTARYVSSSRSDSQPDYSPAT